jgi:hypothetical protein
VAEKAPAPPIEVLVNGVATKEEKGYMEAEMA